MAATYDRLPIHSVLLAGVILNAIFSALIMFITSIMEPNRSFGMMAWLMGSLTAPAYPTLAAFRPICSSASYCSLNRSECSIFWLWVKNRRGR